jgi:hypothetical protein
MKNFLIIMLSAVATIAGVEAKPVEHPVMHPIAHPTNPELEKPQFKCKKHHKHHVRPHRHGKRHIRKPIIIRKGEHVCPRCGEKHAPGKQPKIFTK